MNSTQADIVANRIPVWQRAIEAVEVDGCAVVVFTYQGDSLQVTACFPRDFTHPACCNNPADVLGDGCLVKKFLYPNGQVAGYVGVCGGDENSSAAHLQKRQSDKLLKVANYIELDLSVYCEGNERCGQPQAGESSEHQQHSHGHFETVLNSIGDAVIVTDTAATITHINPVASSITGWSAEEAVGCSLGKVLRSRNIDGSAAGIGGSCVSVDAQDSPVAHDLYLYARNGEARRISCSAAPIRRQSKTCDGLVLVFRDTTREHALQQKLRQSERLQSIGQLAGGIAHDFNNMLGAIQASGELLQIALKQENASSQECVEIILGASRKATQLTGQLLAFARRGQLSTKPVELHAIMNAALELLSRTVDRRIVLLRSFDAVQTVVNGDVGALQNMLLNTVVNASHALVEGGTIAVSTRNIELSAEECLDSSFDLLPGEYCEIVIRDDGEGIEPQDLAKVFDPFYTTKSPGGSGLGLSAAYGTIQDHGGSIDVQSSVGRGTAIRILLPTAAAATAPGERTNGIASNTGASAAKKAPSEGCVLVVDDDATVRASARLVLNSLGYEVLEAANGLDALAAFEESQAGIDVVLLDINMPEMNGLEVYERLLDIAPGVRVVVASGFIDERYCNAFGESQIIHKPYSVSDLKDAIKSAAMQSVA